MAIGNQQILKGRLTQEFHLTEADLALCLAKVKCRLERLIDEVKLAPTPIPVILVGGGSVLVGEQLDGCSQVLRPPHYSVANAVGAAIAQVSGSDDRVISLADTSREDAKTRVINEAIARAVQLGADPGSTVITEYDEIPLAYLPGNAVRFRAKAVGDLNLSINANSTANNMDVAILGFQETVEIDDKMEGTKVDIRLTETMSFHPDYKPKVTDGVWELSQVDIELITIGASILGSGGGGNPYIGRLKVMEAMKLGKVNVIKANKLGSDEISIPCGMMGAPLVINEKIPKGDEILSAFRAVEDELGRKAGGVIGFEIGGLNSVEPMIVAALTGRQK